MQTQRQISTSATWTAFLPLVARDVVRNADGAEGLDAWLAAHGGNAGAPSRATRAYAEALFGDTEEADILNAVLMLEIDRQRRRAG
ncbi:MAG: hypothetical protein VW405_09245 [Rhodospirillaceae bacterium]